MAINLNPSENIIDTWTLLYVPQQGGKYNGKLTITNQRLLYDAKLDASLMGVLQHRTASGYLEIAKSEIQTIDVQKKLFSKRATIILTDGSVHVFDYGAMNIDKCV